jgi:hypothetical protein
LLQNACDIAQLQSQSHSPWLVIAKPTLIAKSTKEAQLPMQDTARG